MWAGLFLVHAVLSPCKNTGIDLSVSKAKKVGILINLNMIKKKSFQTMVAGGAEPPGCY